MSLRAYIAQLTGRKGEARKPAASPPSDAKPATPEARAAAIMAACTTAGVPAAAAPLIAAAAGDEAVQAAIDNAVGINRQVAIARKMLPLGVLPDDAAEGFISAGASGEHVGHAMLEFLVAHQSPEIITAHQPGHRPATPPAGAGDRVNGRDRDDRMSGADLHGWDKAIGAATGRANGAAR